MKKLIKITIIIFIFASIACIGMIKFTDIDIIGRFIKVIQEVNHSNNLKETWNDEDRRNKIMNSDSSIKEYLRFQDMISDENLKNGDVCKTLGFGEVNDGGIGYWKIKKADDVDNLLTFSLNNNNLMAEYILENNMQLNVKALGIKSDIDSEAVKAINTDILKRLILRYKKDKCFYFPIGKYYFNQIDIEDTGYYKISLYGESGGDSKSAFKTEDNVTINTPNSGFINRITNIGNNETKFVVSNIKFIRAKSFNYKPEGICLGTTNNNGYEYNFQFKNVMFYGYEYGFKSPGYTCGGSRGYMVNFTHCIYGVYIEDASHNFIMDSIELNYCKYGIRMGVGGNPCSISNIHVATGVFSGINLDSGEKMYAIHTKGGLVIDSMYYEQYSGEIDVSNYTLLDYEGWGHGNVGKLIVKNTPVGNMGAGNKGYFFTGSTFVGAGPEMGVEDRIQLFSQDRNNYFSNGAVEFINCLGTGTLDSMKDKIRNSFNVSGGLNNAFGFTFDDLDLFGDGLTFTKNYRRRFSSYLTKGNYNEEKLLNIYTTLSIPEEKRIWSGIEFPIGPITDNSENVKGTQYKGCITVDRIQNKDINISLGIIGIVDGEYKMIKELAKLDNSSVNKLVKIYIDEYIPKKEAKNTFFGYKCNGSDSVKEKLSEDDEKKINYDIEINYDNLEMLNK